MEIILLMLFLFFYFMPAIIGYKHRNFNSICCLNLFLGWTFIGWIIALIWAVSKDKREVIIQQPTVQNDKYDELRKLKMLLNEGVITKEEFENQKSSLLMK